MSIQGIIQLLGGVGIFLFSIKLISESLQLIAGDKLRQIVGSLTKTPLLGLMVGALVTVLIQSSSATTVMTVSFVDAGLMTLSQAIGVIMGANIGTTITGQIIAIKIKDYAYLFIIIGVLLSFFGRSKVQKYAGSGLLGFGLLFVGMQTMETSMSFLKERQDIFLTFSSHPLLGVLAGTVLTVLVQSSSATVGLTIALGMQGLLPLDAAVPIILGDNLGTTITAVLAAVGTKRVAKQACTAHVLFNLFGVCIILPILPLFINLVSHTADTIPHQIANAHTLFNVGIALIFLPFVNTFAKLIRKILPEVAHNTGQEPKYLDPKLITASPVMAVEAVKNECVHMGFLAIHILDLAQDLFFHSKSNLEVQVLQTEDSIDHLYASIKRYVPGIWQAGLSDDASKMLESYIRCSGDLERISDRGEELIGFWKYRQTAQRQFSPQAMLELSYMFNEAKATLMTAQDALIHNDRVKAQEVLALASHVRQLEVDLRNSHIRRLDRQECDTETGLIFADILKCIESISFHAGSIAEVVVKGYK